MAFATPTTESWDSKEDEWRILEYNIIIISVIFGVTE